MEQEEVWDRISVKWADFRDKPLRDVEEFLRDKRGKVLDLGCGSGRHGPMNLGIGVSDLEICGIDFSEKLLDLAARNSVPSKVDAGAPSSSGNGAGYSDLKKSEVFEIPYGDEFFDGIVFARVLHCVEGGKNRKKTLGECYRVLKKGGEMYISAWGRGTARLKNRDKEGFVPWTVGEEKLERYTYIYDFEELKADLIEVGFEIVRSWEDGCSCFVVRKG